MIMVYELATTGGTTASGSWSCNTNKLPSGLLGHVFIDFTSDDTVFDFKLIDSNDREVVRLEDMTKTFNREYRLPVKGIYTLQISNATADEYFKLRFAVQDV